MNRLQEWIVKNIGGVDLKALTSFTHSIGSVANRATATIMRDANETFVDEGFGSNDILYAICTITADKERMSPWAAYKIKEEKFFEKYQAEMRKVGTPDFNIKKALDYRTKGMEEYTGDGKLNQILDWPNENETFSDLVANSGISKRLTGNRFIKATLLDLGSNKGKPQELHLLPSQHVEIEATATFPARVSRYKMQLGSEHIYQKEEVMHDRLYNPVYAISGDDLYGMSPIKAGRYLLTRNKSAKMASVKSFDNLGPENVMYLNDPRINIDQAEAQLGAIRQRLDQMSGAKNRKKTAISAFPVGVAPLGLSPVDLDIITAEKWDTVSIANIYNFPHILLLPDHSTLNNLKEAEKALTTRCALPYLVSFRDNFNRKLSTDWGYKGQGIFVDFDLSVYSELQRDMKELTQWVKDSWWFTPRLRYELQQMDIPEEIRNRPELDMIFIPSGFTEIGSLNPDAITEGLNDIDDELDAADK